MYRDLQNTVVGPRSLVINVNVNYYVVYMRIYCWPQSGHPWAYLNLIFNKFDERKANKCENYYTYKKVFWNKSSHLSSNREKENEIMFFIWDLLRFEKRWPQIGCWESAEESAHRLALLCTPLPLISVFDYPLFTLVNE